MKVMKNTINERMKFYNVQGVSFTLINDGKISFSEELGILETKTENYVNSNSIFNACSISKFVTTILVLKLTENGMLDLDEDVNEKLMSWKVPENNFTKNSKVTLRTLLSHQSGFIDPIGSFGVVDPKYAIPTMLEIVEGKTPYCLESCEVKYEPGSDFQYSDLGFCVIQLLLEDISGKPFVQLMNELVFEPLLMKNSTLESSIPEYRRTHLACGHNKKGEIVDGKYPIYPYPATAGLWTTSQDLAILANELLNSINGNSKVGISQGLAVEMITPQGCVKWTGLGVFLDNKGEEFEISSLGWGVGFQCMMIIYPYLETAAIIMTNTDLGIHQTKGIIGEIFELFLPRLLANRDIHSYN